MDENWKKTAIKPPLGRNAVQSFSSYLTMRDGIKIAIDVHLPKQLPTGQKLPTILRGTRYYRQYEYRFPFSYWLNGPDALTRQWLANGYARVNVDARGSGASFGHWSGPWSPDEVKDYGEVVDWIVRQPWSNGKVGATGVSYDGTSAEMLLATCHPAVRAVVPRFSLFDIYADIAYPGGIHLSWFTENWSQAVNALDENRYPLYSRDLRTLILARGIMPVNGDRQELARALAGHIHNGNIHTAVLGTPFRDLPWAMDPRLTIDAFSPHGYIDRFNQTGAAVYSYGGWYDGAYARAVIQRYLSLKNHHCRMILGPWNHGGTHKIGPPFGQPTRFDHMAEMIRFFDGYLKETELGLDGEEPIHYYTLREEQWKAASSWPPPADAVPYYLQANNRLSTGLPATPDAADSYIVDYTAGTGSQSRWNCLFTGKEVIYPDRQQEDQKLLAYTSAPLASALEVTGHPLLNLYLIASAPDIHLFAYLEDVEPSGRVTYVTEGMLRAIHRQTCPAPPYATLVPYRTYASQHAHCLEPGIVTQFSFDLLPISYLFKPGHAIRLAIAGADKDHFSIPPYPPPVVQIFRSVAYGSHLLLPCVRT